jgi:hypothetical protein
MVAYVVATRSGNQEWHYPIIARAIDLSVLQCLTKSGVADPFWPHTCGQQSLHSVAVQFSKVDLRPGTLLNLCPDASHLWLRARRAPAHLVAPDFLVCTKG